MTEESTFGSPGSDEGTRSEPSDARSASWLPTTIGHYRVVRLVGEGGMGAVYEAEQDNPRRTVALKVIKPGWATPAMLSRFEQEAHALGRLQHVGIAQIHEAGTADTAVGRQPYFAMEFIRGRALPDFVSAHRLNVRGRLDLVVKICEAVQHAHQRGLIHRDLKPANILIDESGQPKILDFGVARITDSDTLATRQTDIGQLVGTLAYMSPEQVRADPLALDTRSDVYALGVILYEVLATRPPYALSREVHAAVRTILEEDPTPLSTVDRLYRGDIETIVAKALEKNKERRYGSAAELADDIRRYLNDEPIVARPPSTIYQLQKFARRHRALVTGIAAVFIVLAGGLVASAWQAARATRAEQSALVERDRATAAERQALIERDRALNAEQAATRELNRAVTAEAQAVQERNRALAQTERANFEAANAAAVNTFLRDDLLAQASANRQARADTAPNPDLTVRTALDRASVRIADRFAAQPLVDASIRQTIGRTYVDLGIYPQAEAHVARALELRRRQLGETHPDTLTSMNDLAVLYRHQGKYADAEGLHRGVLAARRRVLGPEHRDTLASMHDLAMLYQSQTKYTEAEALELQALAIRRRVLGDDHADTLASRSILAGIYLDSGRPQLAEPLHVEVTEGLRRRFGEEHPEYLESLNDLGGVYFEQGKYAQSEQLFAKVLAVRQRVLGAEHPDTLNAMNNLAGLYGYQNRLDEAELLHGKALEQYRRVLGDEHRNTLLSRYNLALIYHRQGKWSQAESLYSESLAIQRRVLGEEHAHTLLSMNGLATTYRAQRRYAEAELLHVKAVEVQRRVFGDDHPTTLAMITGLASLYRAQGKYADAVSLLSHGLDSRRRTLGEQHPDTLVSIHHLAVALRDAGRYDEAETHFVRALDLRRRVLGDEHADTTSTAIEQAILMRHQRQHVKAAALLVKALDVERRTLGPQHPDTITTTLWLGRVRLEQQQASAAEALLREAAAYYTKSTADDWGRYNQQALLGASLAAQKRYDEAEPLLIGGYEGLAAREAMIPIENRWFVRAAGEWIVGLYRDWGKLDKADEWRHRLRSPGGVVEAALRQWPGAPTSARVVQLP